MPTHCHEIYSEINQLFLYVACDMFTSTEVDLFGNINCATKAAASTARMVGATQIAERENKMIIKMIARSAFGRLK